MRRTPALLLAGACVLAAAPALYAEPGPPKGRSAEFVVLDYHSFIGDGSSNLDFSLEELGAQLDRIAASGYRFVRLEDALAGRIEGRANVVVTIDDGHRTVYRAFREVFEPRGILPFLFVYPAIVENRVRYALKPDELDELARAGCGIGAHGYNHSSLSEEAWRKDYVQFGRELKLPGPALRRLTGLSPTLYAYPFGLKSERAAEALPGYGYEAAFVAGEDIRPIRVDDPSLDRMALPRTIMYRFSGDLVIRSMAGILASSGSPSPR